MANATAIEQSRRARLLNTTSLDRGAERFASAQSSGNREDDIASPEDPVAPPIPVPEPNQAWSPNEDTNNVSPLSFGTRGPREERSDEREGNGLLVDPLSGDEMRQDVGDRAIRLARSKAVASVAGVATGGTGAIAVSALQGAIEQSGLGEDLQKEVQAGATRGIVYIAEILVDALDIGTVGAAILVDFVVHFFTLGFLNVQMIYGSWIAKGESSIIAPLDWKPLPLNGILPVIILYGVVIFLDLFVLFITGVIGLSLIFILYALYSFYTDPIGFAQNLLTGSGLFAPLAPVFRTLFGI